MTQEKAIEELSFEEALSELEAIIKSLETGEAALDNSISAYERGIKLKNYCENKLREAQAKIEKISVKQDGSISIQPLNLEDK